MNKSLKFVIAGAFVLTIGGTTLQISNSSLEISEQKATIKKAKVEKIKLKNDLAKTKESAKKAESKADNNNKALNDLAKKRSTNEAAASSETKAIEENKADNTETSSPDALNENDSSGDKSLAKNVKKTNLASETKEVEVVQLSAPEIAHKKDVYIVKSGDTLNKISSVENISVGDISKINNIDDINLIYVGDILSLNTSQISTDYTEQKEVQKEQEEQKLEQKRKQEEQNKQKLEQQVKQNEQNEQAVKQSELEVEQNVEVQKEESSTNSSQISYSQFLQDGVVNSGGYKYTYYSQSVLSGGGLNIPGRHLEDGFVKDGDGNIVLAGPVELRNSNISTPFGNGKVYDMCEAGNIDVYVQ